jgi:nitrate/nitrite transport system ATP-binding protein
MTQFLNLENISKVDEASIPMINHINLEVYENEIISFVGHKGCGKTTLLNIIAGLTKQSQGSITLRKQVVEGPGHDRSVVFEKHNFLPWFTSYENIAFVLNKMMPELHPNELEERVNAFMQLAELEKVKDLLPCKLSMEIKKRLAIIRALATNPDILLMDNSFSSLTTNCRHSLQDFLLKVQKHTKTTIIISTGNVEEALYLSDRIVLMQKGENNIHEVLKLELPKPRDRVRLQGNPNYTSYREKVYDFLYNKTRETV